MKKMYKVIGILPLAFPDGQEVESGEEFERDFEKTTGVTHEQFLVETGHIVEIKPTKVPAAPKPAKEPRE